jgi:hypothetical protein
MLPLPEHDRCILTSNHAHRSLHTQFCLPGRLMQNNNPDDTVCLYGDTDKTWDALLFPVFVYGNAWVIAASIVVGRRLNNSKSGLTLCQQRRKKIKVVSIIPKGCYYYSPKHLIFLLSVGVPTNRNVYLLFTKLLQSRFQWYTSCKRPPF